MLKMINWEFLTFFLVFYVVLFVLLGINWKRVAPLFKNVSEVKREQIEKITGKKVEITRRLTKKHLGYSLLLIIILILITNNMNTEERVLIVGPAFIPVVLLLYRYYLGNLPD